MCGDGHETRAGGGVRPTSYDPCAMARVRRDSNNHRVRTLRTMPGRTLIAAAAMVGAGVLVGPPALASGGAQVVRPALQPDWPKGVPVPVATITGTSGLRPSETVGLLARGSAAQVGRSVVALYTSHGFRQAVNGTLVFTRRPYRITASLRNHDHSASRTDVVVWLQTR